MMFYFTIAVARSILIARIIWIFYVIYYIAIFFYKAIEVGWTNIGSSFPYVAAIIAGIIIFFGLSTMRNFLFKGQLEEKEERAIKDIKFRELGRGIERAETTSRTST
jgi:hypothetical protein